MTERDWRIFREDFSITYRREIWRQRSGARSGRAILTAMIWGRDLGGRDLGCGSDLGLFEG